ncbi:DUF1372 family protein [Streptococcus suis]|uniref:DUF1372 family protein n=1 Tax=Streptococcus suis TaxID=1307 RepID=UPI00094583DB|nr:DUF1372 family protein [Streptococcus suis]MBS8081769.1 DUF1372 family protein [Streptococcus suis]MCB2862010.1 DUF1372 family protein [Streptococcus suis]MCB2888703.1 DUF1372 family protein [Streptococcus suis]MCG9868476.1 DUF1372 family protein [Streptococcus suis]MCG9870534.1 DUF1372 family protein [Streptococcus suis]
MERFEKVLNPLVILFGVIIVLIIKLEQSKQEIMRLKEQQPVIIYQVDNAGTEMFGKVTAKDVVDGHYYVEVKPYGKFLVTREQYEEIKIGQEMPEYLKGRKQ